MVLTTALRKELHSKQPLMASWTASPRLKDHWRCIKRTGFQGATDGCAALRIVIVSTHTAQQYSWLVAQKCKSHNSIANSFFHTHALPYLLITWGIDLFTHVRLLAASTGLYSTHAMRVIWACSAAPQARQPLLVLQELHKESGLRQKLHPTVRKTDAEHHFPSAETPTMAILS